MGEGGPLAIRNRMTSSAGWSQTELSPVTLLRRAVTVFPEEVAIQHGDSEVTYGKFGERVERLTGALIDCGLKPGDRVAAMLGNTPEMLELHFATAAAGIVLVPVNTRLAPAEVRYILTHSEARLVVADRRFSDLVLEALASSSLSPLQVWSPAPPHQAPHGSIAIEPWIQSARPRVAAPPRESSLLSVNYTSGTTGRPKGVMYTHRGAFLQALSVMAIAGLHATSRYLWTLPMFHCQGWGFIWALTGAAGKHICLPAFDPVLVWQHLRQDGVTHFCGAPTALTMLLRDVPDGTPEKSTGPVRVFTGGSAPSPALLERGAAAGWELTHLYGLTETYGPSVVGERRASWDALDRSALAAMVSRQGGPGLAGVDLRVVDDSMEDQPADGESMGEVVLRGNTVTIGYYRDEAATARAFDGGWFRTGDLAVRHRDGSIELKDRLKDMVISGGENISTIEVEQALAAHPEVEEVAVVAVPHDMWGETPKAFVVLRRGGAVTTNDLIAFGRERLAGFKAPRQVEIRVELPKTATGKVLKFMLRELDLKASHREIS